MDAVDTVKLAMTKAWASGFTTEVEQMLIDNLPTVLSLARSNGWQDIASEDQAKELLIATAEKLNIADRDSFYEMTWGDLLDVAVAALRTKVGDERDAPLTEPPPTP